MRVVVRDGEPWVVGKDVASALEYSNPSNAAVIHVDDEDKTIYLNQVAGSNYKSKTTIINESGIYSLIMSSKLPQAKAFKRWVTSEALPGIRKQGMYMTANVAEDAIKDTRCRRPHIIKGGWGKQ